MNAPMTNPPVKSASSSNFMDSMKAAAMKGKDLATKKFQGALTSVGTHMTIPMIKKFREDLTKQISNKTEWEKRPREDREAIFNEIKAISKLLHHEGYRANFARNFLTKKGGKTKRSSSKNKKKKTLRRKK